MSNPVSQAEFERALDDLIMQESPPYLSETDVTVTKLAKRANVGKPKARAMIDKWCAAGQVEAIKRRDGRGRPVEAWRLITKGNE